MGVGSSDYYLCPGERVAILYSELSRVEVGVTAYCWPGSVYFNYSSLVNVFY